MNKLTLLILFIALKINLIAQPYPIGHREITYNDPSRNRNIPVHIYYPAVSAGNNTSVAVGQFPLLVFGHGFAMSYSAYENVWEALVPQGYIMVLPTTEGSLIPGPSHGAFGEDLRFLNTKMKSEGNNSASPFYQSIGATSAIMGHSMGGGASFLAAQNNNDITTLVSFAPAETTPSAITAAASITVPALIFYGENDGVTPLLQHQLPMYDSLASVCKTMISILGGGHCYFGNYNFNCATGELATSPQPSISRAEQHDVLFDLLIPYLNATLKNSATDAQVFLDSLDISQRISYQRSCVTTGINSEPQPVFHLYPNPLKQGAILQVSLSPETPIENVVVLDLAGRRMPVETNMHSGNIVLKDLMQGVYIVQVFTRYGLYTDKVFVL